MTNFKKSYSQISEKKQDQTSINLTNVFDFIGWFSNYIGFDVIKWLCVIHINLQQCHNIC